jgi:hypothetical protein
MKNILRIVGHDVRSAFRKLALVAGVCTLAFSLQNSAFGQIASPTLYSLTNVPVTLASNVVCYQTNIIPLTKNCALAVAGRTVTSLGAGTEVLSGSFGLDGTNFGLAPFTLTVPLSTTYPTNGVTMWTNWPQNYLSGFAYVNFTLITNTGPGTVTNYSWLVSRPTLNTSTY